MAITISVTIVDHTSSPNMLAQITPFFEDILSDLIWEAGEVSVVNVRRVTATPVASDQDLVLHFVRDVSQSYINQKMHGRPINPRAGGHTRSRGNISGSEFYKVPRLASPQEYAKMAAHEAMHNITRSDDTIHRQGGIADSTPQLPVNSTNRQSFQAGLNSIPDQLL